VYSTSVRLIGVELPAFLRHGHGTLPELLYSFVKREMESMTCIHEGVSFKLLYLLVKREREREMESMICIHEGVSFVHESIHSQ
jgi:hypothetical protein